MKILRESEKKKFSKTELAKKPWYRQRGVYESIQHFLASSIDKLNDLQSSVLTSMKESGLNAGDAEIKDFGVDERILTGEFLPAVSVVAEEKGQYGADAFDEYMKTDATVIDALVEDAPALT